MNMAKNFLSSKGNKGGSSGGKGNIKTKKTPEADTPSLAETGVGKNGTSDSMVIQNKENLNYQTIKIKIMITIQVIKAIINQWIHGMIMTCT